MQLYQVKGTPEAEVELLATTDCGLVKFRTLLNNEVIESTKEAFELGFEPVKQEFFNFGQALEKLKAGEKVARHGWNGKGMYIQKNKGVDFEHAIIEPFFVIKNVKNSFNTWVPSVSDLLAEDWTVVE
jgi:hypothetical protein